MSESLTQFFGRAASKFPKAPSTFAANLADITGERLGIFTVEELQQHQELVEISGDAATASAWQSSLIDLVLAAGIPSAAAHNVADAIKRTLRSSTAPSAASSQSRQEDVARSPKKTSRGRGRPFKTNNNRALYPLLALLL